jgi:hypothetical protein
VCILPWLLLTAIGFNINALVLKVCGLVMAATAAAAPVAELKSPAKALGEPIPREVYLASPSKRLVERGGVAGTVRGAGDWGGRVVRVVEADRSRTVAAPDFSSLP